MTETFITLEVSGDESRSGELLFVAQDPDFPGCVRVYTAGDHPDWWGEFSFSMKPDFARHLANALLQVAEASEKLK